MATWRRRSTRRQASGRPGRGVDASAPQSDPQRRGAAAKLGPTPGRSRKATPKSRAQPQSSVQRRGAAAKRSPTPGHRRKARSNAGGQPQSPPQAPRTTAKRPLSATHRPQSSVERRGAAAKPGRTSDNREVRPGFAVCRGGLLPAEPCGLRSWPCGVREEACFLRSRLTTRGGALRPTEPTHARRRAGQLDAQSLPTPTSGADRMQRHAGMSVFIARAGFTQPPTSAFIALAGFTESPASDRARHSRHSNTHQIPPSRAPHRLPIAIAYGFPSHIPPSLMGFSFQRALRWLLYSTAP